jgi:ribosomal protein S18 acetylase RimI-like enzyme
MDYSIEPLTADHLPAVIDLHLTRFPDDFITALGEPWLRRVFYPAYVDLPGGFGFVAVSDDQVQGYIVGSEDGRGFYQRMLQGRLWYLLWRLFRQAARRPRIVGRAAAVSRTVRTEPEPPVPADLSYIAVSPEAEHQGVGAALVTALADHLRARGHSGCWVKAWAENFEADRFYQSVGFQPDQDYYSDGRWWRLYVLELNEPGRSEL